MLWAAVAMIIVGCSAASGPCHQSEAGVLDLRALFGSDGCQAQQERIARFNEAFGRRLAVGERPQPAMVAVFADPANNDLLADPAVLDHARELLDLPTAGTAQAEASCRAIGGEHVAHHQGE